MKKALLTCAAVLFSFSLFPVMIQAETDDQASTETTNIEKRYVADSLWLQLRSGPGNEYRILKQLKSGEHLIFLKQTDDKKYTRVKTPKGVEGWVLSRFLLKEPIAKEKLILAQRAMKQLKAELKTTQTQRNELQAQLESSKSDRSGLNRDQEKLEEELKRIKSISANALTLDEKNKKLSQRNQELEIQIEALTTENNQLQDDTQLTYLIYGGGLVVIGIIAGLLLPSLRGGKRNDGWA